MEALTAEHIREAHEKCGHLAFKDKQYAAIAECLNAALASMNNQITLKLTLAEAIALDRAVGNSIGSEEDAIAILHEKEVVNAAYRAAQKLGDAVSVIRSKGEKP